MKKNIIPDIILSFVFFLLCVLSYILYRINRIPEIFTVLGAFFTVLSFYKLGFYKKLLKKTRIIEGELFEFEGDIFTMYSEFSGKAVIHVNNNGLCIDLRKNPNSISLFYDDLERINLDMNILSLYEKGAGSDDALTIIFKKNNYPYLKGLMNILKKNIKKKK